MKKKALITSMALLLVAIVCLSTATYAWFTSSPVAGANNFAVKTHAAGSLYITDAASPATADWKTSIDIGLQNTPTYQPVSTVDCATFYTGQADVPTAKDVNSSKYSETSDNYYSKNVKFKSNEAGDLYLSAFTCNSNATGGQYDLLKKSLRVGVKVGNDVKIYALDTNSTDLGVNSTTTTAAVGLIKGTYNVGTNNANAIATFAAADDVIDATIFIWIEGEDASCYTTNVSNGVTLDDIDLSFTVATVQP